MWITIGEQRFAVVLADTDAARELSKMLPLTLAMEDLNGNEKHAELPKALPTDASHPKKIRNGDLMLWGARTIVVFYKTFDSSYPYTRLGHIEGATDLPRALWPSKLRVTFSKN